MLGSCGDHDVVYQKQMGKVFGTYYKVIYSSEDDLHKGIIASMSVIDSSLSTFNPKSIISSVNQNDPGVILDDHFKHVFLTAQHVSTQTNGAFDITVAPLVNAWGFGFDPKQERNKGLIDSLSQFVGFQKLTLVDDKLFKEDARTLLDCSAIAKGYACDVVAHYLNAQGVENYLVDIGGELCLRGYNPKGEVWKIGVNRAFDDTTQTNQSIQRILQLSNCGVATSGNYRQYYITKERRISHTIDPRTGYPANSQVLSATVIAKNTLLADAYATACMVMGDVTEITRLVDTSSDSIEVFLIVDKEGVHQEVYSRGMDPLFAK